MRNILINIPNISKKDGGIYQYSLALVRLLAKDFSDFQFYVLCNKPGEDLSSVIDGNSNFKLVSEDKFSSSITKRKKSGVLAKLTRKVGMKLPPASDIYDLIIEKYRIDIIHSPYQNLVKKKGVKSITTLHDVQELHFPEFFSSAQRAHRAVFHKRYIDEADLVIVSYDHIKKDIIKYFEKSPEMIHTILLNMENLWFEDFSILDIHLFEDFSLPEKFILYPAATWQHKNHLRLLEAIGNMDHPDIFLVCTGNKTQNFYENIEPFIKENSLSDKVKFLGIVSDEQLYSLYKNCQAVVVPTLYEAGSFPLMESILMNIPVICSNVTSLPETIGDMRFVFDPDNIYEISERIEQIWFDEGFRSENLKTLKVQKRLLINTGAEDKLRRIYEEL